MPHITLRRRAVSNRGFTVPEILVAITIFSTLVALSAAGLASAGRVMQGAAGMQQVRAQLRLARDLAISQRRPMEVQFVAPNEIRTIRWEIPTGTTTLNQYFLEGNVEFHRFASVPDTPDGFGLGAAVSFTGQSARFLSDGRFVDAQGVPLSGNIFLAIQGQPTSQHAVTIFGGSGRMRGYRWDGTQWVN